MSHMDAADCAHAGIKIGPFANTVPMSPPPEEEDAESRVALPAFPLEVFPPLFRETVEAFASLTNSPVEMAALPAMAVIGTALGPRWRVGAEGRFVRAPALWLIVVAGSGKRKTPTMKPVLAPLVEHDRALGDDYEAALERHESRAKAARKRGSTVEDPGPPPERRRELVTDATVEALVAELQKAEGHGLLFHADELATLLEGMDGYSKGRKGRATWLSLWSGTAIRCVRKTSKSVEVDEPFVNVLGGVQPLKLADLSLRDSDGLFPRFLWAHVSGWGSGLGKRLGHGALDLWRSQVREALDLREARKIPFTPEADDYLDRRLMEWGRLAHELEDARLSLAANMVDKGGDQLVRIAALLHGLDTVEARLSDRVFGHEVPVETVRRARVLVDYFLAHGGHSVRLVIGPKTQGAIDAKVSHVDKGLADALARLVAPGQELEGSSSELAELLAGVGFHLAGKSPASKLGRALGRLAAAPIGSVRVARLPRSKQRRWRVWRDA